MEIREKTAETNDIICYRTRARETQMPIETKHNRQNTQVEIPEKKSCLTGKKRIILFIAAQLLSLESSF